MTAEDPTGDPTADDATGDPTGDGASTEAWFVALASLPKMGPARLAALVSGRTAAEAWRLVRSGAAHRQGPVAGVLGRDAEAISRAWASEARRLDTAALMARHVDAGVGVLLRGSPGYPEVLLDDPEPPQVLFHRGDLGLLAGPRVAIVGTRQCTRYGVDVAFEFGRDLADAGVRVVSGLAVGIDGAAHAGALAAEAAPPIAVVGNGLDIVYPARNRSLWRRVEAAGVMLSEYPLGMRPKPWTFPARNRLIAALGDVVVVVESHRQGGSMYTVDEAERRGRTIMAVPGSVRSPSSRGTNHLLADGLHVACDPVDVLTALGLDAGAHQRGADPRPMPAADDRTVLEAIDWEPVAFEQLALRTGRSLGELSLTLTRLEEQGWIAHRGAWYERVAAR